MFRYFPTNDVRNLSVDLAIEMGARIGEIEAMCAPLQEAAKAPDAAGTQAFSETWVEMAERLQAHDAPGRLDGVVERICVPFLVTHGEKDSQIPLKWAHRTYEQLVNSPRRTLKVFTDHEGRVQHSSFDASINAGHCTTAHSARALRARTLSR